MLLIICCASVCFSAGCSCAGRTGANTGEDVPIYDETVSHSDTASDPDSTVTSSDAPADSHQVTTAASESTTTTTQPTTTKASTTTAKSSTTSTASATTAAPTTTSSTGTDTRQNADYVVNPNYESEYYIVVFAGNSQSVAIYSKDETGAYTVLARCFTCSTGADSSPTRTGQYRIRAKYRWRWLVGGVYGQYSSSISSSYLFHSVPYLKQDASTLDMTEYDKLGTPASHGCIRLCVRDSKWIYDNCPIGTQVNIVNASGPAGAGFPARLTDSIYKGWDPSDPAAANPYHKAPTTTASTAVTTATTTAVSTTTTTASESTESDVTTTTASAAESTTQSSAETTTAATTATTAARWVSSSEISSIIANLRKYAQTLELQWDEMMNENNCGYWGPSTRAYTTACTSASQFEDVLKNIIYSVDKQGLGYEYVNAVAVEQADVEYIVTIYFR